MSLSSDASLSPGAWFLLLSLFITLSTTIGALSTAREAILYTLLAVHALSLGILPTVLDYRSGWASPASSAQPGEGLAVWGLLTLPAFAAVALFNVGRRPRTAARIAARLFAALGVFLAPLLVMRSLSFHREPAFIRGFVARLDADNPLDLLQQWTVDALHHNAPRTIVPVTSLPPRLAQRLPGTPLIELYGSCAKVQYYAHGLVIGPPDFRLRDRTRDEPLSDAGDCDSGLSGRNVHTHMIRPGIYVFSERK